MDFAVVARNAAEAPLPVTPEMLLFDGLTDFDIDIAQELGPSKSPTGSGNHRRRSTASSLASMSSIAVVLEATTKMEPDAVEFSRSSPHSWDYDDDRDFVPDPEQIIKELDNVQSKPTSNSQKPLPLVVSTGKNIETVSTVTIASTARLVQMKSGRENLAEPGKRFTDGGSQYPLEEVQNYSPMKIVISAEGKDQKGNFFVGSTSQDQEQRTQPPLTGSTAQDTSQAETTEEDDRDQSLARYRMKRLRRVFNRIRYTLRKQVSENRPRVKGRFIKSAPQGSTGTPSSPDTEVGRMANEETPQSLPRPGPRKSGAPSTLLSETVNNIQNNNITTISTVPLTIQIAEGFPFPSPQADASQEVSTVSSAEDPPSRKRKSSFLRFSPSSLMSSLSGMTSSNTQGENAPPPLPGSVLPRKRFSFTKATNTPLPIEANANTSQHSGDNSSTHDDKPAATNKRSSWSRRLSMFSTSQETSA